MTLCKNCGTVFDEFYGVCPKCGTPCEADAPSDISLPPIGSIPAPSDPKNTGAFLPPIEIAIQNSGTENGIPHNSHSPVTDPDATIPVQRPIDPDATIPVQRPIDPDATIPVQRPIDPDATIPVQRPIDPDATIPLRKPVDPDATIPLRKPVDPDATIPLRKPVDPDATVPLRKPVDPDATVPLQRKPVQTPPQVPPEITQTQEIPISGNQQYGDEYSAATVSAAKNTAPPKKHSSTVRIVAIILIVAMVLSGCGVGVYFLFFHKPQTVVSQTVSEGDRSYAQGDYEKAAELFRKAVSETPENAEVYQKLADAYIAAGHTDEAIKALTDGYEKTKNEKLKEMLDTLNVPQAPTEPEAFRDNARSMNMAVLNLYAGVTNGSVSADSPSNELRGLSPSRLPKAGATASDREAAANALTIQDVVIYAQLTDKITAATINSFVYSGASVYYKEDHAGTPLTFGTTIGDIRGVSAEPSSEPSKADQPSEEPSRQESSEPSEESLSPADDPELNAAALLNAGRSLYAEVIAGTLNATSHGNVDRSSLPSAGASAERRKKYADLLTVKDAIAYAGLESTFNKDTIGNYIYNTDGLMPKGKAAGIVLTLDTKLRQFVSTPTEESSAPEPSEVQSSAEPVSKPESSAEPSAPESSRDEPSEVQSSEPTDTPDISMAALAGKWEAELNTAAYTAEQIKEYREMLGYDEFVILLNTDGSASAYQVVSGATDILGSGTWTLSGDQVAVTIDGDLETFTYENGHLNTPAYGDVVYFVRKS